MGCFTQLMGISDPGEETPPGAREEPSLDHELDSVYLILSR